MNQVQRRLIIERDGRECVICRQDGQTCAGNSEPCKLSSPTLNAVTYWKLDANRPTYARLQVDHIIGRVGGAEKTERYENVATLCPCHHARKDRTMKERELAYAAVFEGTEPQEYLAELAQEAIDAKKRKTSKARARKRQYEHTKKKVGGSPLSEQKGKNPMRGKKLKPQGSSGKPPGVSEKDWAQRQRPVLNGTRP